MGERPTPDTRQASRSRPPRAPSCRPQSAQSQLARARAVGLVTGPHARTPRTRSKWVVGPGRTPERARGRGWESARPRTPHTQARGAPPRAPSCRPPSAQSQLARARPVGLVTGPRARTPRTHSQWVVGPGRTPERTSGRGWESARPRTPDNQAGGAPPGHPHAAPRARKASSQERAVGLVTGPHARTPRTHSKWVVGPGRTPERTRGRGWESAHPRTPHTQARGAPPPGTLMPPPQRAKPACQSAPCGFSDGSPCPHPPHPQPVSSGPRPHARADEWSGLGERPTSETPHQGRRRPPRAPSCRPHSAQSQLAGARAVGLVAGPHARTPRTHSQWVVGPGRTPEQTSGWVWESA